MHYYVKATNKPMKPFVVEAKTPELAIKLVSEKLKKTMPYGTTKDEAGYFLEMLGLYAIPIQ